MTSCRYSRVAHAIDSAEPKEWRGQKDKRTIIAFMDEVKRFVTVTKCVQAKNQTREIARLSLALMKSQEGQLVDKDFAAWRKSQQNPLDAWPDSDDIMKWMNESLTNPKTGVSMRTEFTKLIQLKPGLDGLHTLTSKLKTDYATLSDMGLAPDDFTVKAQFKEALHTSVKRHVAEVIQDSIVQDVNVSAMSFVERVSEEAVKKMQALSGSMSEEEGQYNFKNKKEFVRAVKAANLQPNTPPKGGAKRKSGQERSAAAKVRKQEAVRLAGKGKGKGKGKGGKGGKGKGGKGVPSNWKEIMCSLCGILGHKKETCFHNPDCKTKVPDGFTTYDTADLEAAKKVRVTRYEKEAE